jgi:hypothetical protein
MIVDPDFLDHWKTRMLVGSLEGDESAPLYVLRLWAHCQNRRQDEFDNITTEALKALCHFPGQANKLESSLVTSGFVRRDGKMLVVSGWAEYNASLIAAWNNGKKGGRKTQQKPVGSKTETQQKPVGSRVEKSRVDKNLQEPTITHTSGSLALQSPWNNPKCAGVFDRWFAYLSKIGKPTFDCDQATIALSQMFATPEDLEQAVIAAIAGGWRSVNPSMVHSATRPGSDGVDDGALTRAFDSLDEEMHAEEARANQKP